MELKDLSPTSEIEWGQSTDERFRRDIDILVDAYLTMGTPDQILSVIDFASFISERKGWDDAYRWIYIDNAH